MESSHLSNPFNRDSPFSSNLRGSSFKPSYQYDSIRGVQLDKIYSPKASYNTNTHNNPFEHFQFHGKESRKGTHSEYKDTLRNSGSQNNLGFPLTKYQNKMKLQMLDNQFWKRQKQQQQRYKLEHYGAQALRYSNFSTNAPSIKFDNKNKDKYIQNDNPKRYQQPRLQKLMSFHNQYIQETPKSTAKLFISAEKQKAQQTSPRFHQTQKYVQSPRQQYYSNREIKMMQQNSIKKDQQKQAHQVANPKESNYIPRINQSFSSNYKNPYLKNHNANDNALDTSQGDMFQKRQFEIKKFKNSSGFYASDSQYNQNQFSVMNSHKKSNHRNPYDSCLSDNQQTLKGPLHCAKWSDSEQSAHNQRYRKVSDTIKQQIMQRTQYNSPLKKTYSKDFPPPQIEYIGKRYQLLQTK